MSNPVLSAATRCRCTADDLRSLTPHIPRSLDRELMRVIAALEASASRYEGYCSPAPVPLHKCDAQRQVVDAPSRGAGVSQ